jgi:hypothetical protein
MRVILVRVGRRRMVLLVDIADEGQKVERRREEIGNTFLFSFV